MSQQTRTGEHMHDDEVRRQLERAKQLGPEVLANIGQELCRQPGTTTEQRMIIRDALADAWGENLKQTFVKALRKGGQTKLGEVLEEELLDTSELPPGQSEIILKALRAAFREVED